MRIQLKLWAERNFDPVPCKATIRKWIREGRIAPAPVFIGRAYYVDDNARFIADKMAAPKRPDLRKRLAERIAA